MLFFFVVMCSGKCRLPLAPVQMGIAFQSRFPESHVHNGYISAVNCHICQLFPFEGELEEHACSEA